MKKKVVYVVPRQENVKLYDFTANRNLFKSFKSCGSTGEFDMNATEFPEFDIDVSCSPISLGG